MVVVAPDVVVVSATVVVTASEVEVVSSRVLVVAASEVVVVRGSVVDVTDVGGELEGPSVVGAVESSDPESCSAIRAIRTTANTKSNATMIRH
ncbi:MAG TPA: hypothetical protein VIL12_06340 [Acidimicrobiia bacterium]